MNCFLPIIALLVPGALSFDYCTLSTQNTLCKYKPTSYGTACSQVIPLNFTAADKDAIVNYHNTLRRQVAKGAEKRGTPGPQPSASNMRELTWDDELALMAQTHAQQCVFTHDADRSVSRFRVGQNIAIQFSTVKFTKSDWNSMMKNWYDEVALTNNSFVNKFPSSSLSAIGHYTQIVWANTFKIGCGVVSYLDKAFQPTYPYKIFYVCNYGPAGNFLSQPIYKIGQAASACPSGTTAKDGLCA